MRSESKLPPLIVILGPTAVGKTALSLSLAKEFNGEVVSSDSRLFYQGMDIGTAKPTAAEQVSVPHHLIDVARVDEVWSLGRFKRAADEVIADIHFRGKVPFLVGGTGQFVRAIVEGWVIPELPGDEHMRKVLNAWAEEIGPDGLYQRLEVVDPVAAEKILPGNLRRTIRAFEVIFHTGKRFSELRGKEPVSYRVLQIGLNRPREEIDRRINERVDAMIEGGFVDEVANLLDEGYPVELPSMSAIGYRQLAGYLAGDKTLDQAVEEIKAVTRKFYRRQMSWFRLTDEQIHWFDLNLEPEEEIRKLVQDFLENEE